MNDITETTDNEPLEENNDQDSSKPTKLKRTFINRFGHIRAGWRMMIYLILFVLISIPLNALLIPLKSVPVPGEFSLRVFFYGSVMQVAALMLAAVIILRWIDKRQFGVLGFNFSKGWLKEFTIGLGAGFGLLTLIFFIFWSTGLVSVSPGAMNMEVFNSMMFLLLLFAFAGAFEELLMRGYLFQVMIEGSREWIAVLIFSLIFSLMHIFNPNWSWGGAFNIFLAGVLLSIVYIKTRSLWMPTGLHMAWNWTQGPLWGMNVSGLDIPDTFIVSSPQGPELLSGGDFGAEGSLISSVLIILLSLYLWRAEWLKPSESNASIWRKYPSSYGIEPVDQEM